MLSDNTGLVILHISLTILYFLFQNENKERAFCEALIIFVLPVFGLLIILISKVCSQTRSEMKPVHEDGSMNDPLLLTDGLATDSNILPFQDVLSLEDSRARRTLITDILKRNSLKVAGNLSQALQDSDIEVSHYAASAIMGKRMEYESEIQKLEEDYREQPQNRQMLFRVSDKIGEYLASGLLDHDMKNSYLDRYLETLVNLIHLEQAEAVHYREITELLIEKENYQEAEEYALKFRERYPDREEPFLILIHLHFAQKNYAMIETLIQEMKASDIVFSARGLEIVRFWS